MSRLFGILPEGFQRFVPGFLRPAEPPAITLSVPAVGSKRGIRHATANLELARKQGRVPKFPRLTENENEGENENENENEGENEEEVARKTARDAELQARKVARNAVLQARRAAATARKAAAEAAAKKAAAEAAARKTAVERQKEVVKASRARKILAATVPAAPVAAVVANTELPAEAVALEPGVTDIQLGITQDQKRERAIVEIFRNGACADFKHDFSDNKKTNVIKIMDTLKISFNQSLGISKSVYDQRLKEIRRLFEENRDSKTTFTQFTTTLKTNLFDRKDPLVGVLPDDTFQIGNNYNDEDTVLRNINIDYIRLRNDLKRLSEEYERDENLANLLKATIATIKTIPISRNYFINSGPTKIKGEKFTLASVFNKVVTSSAKKYVLMVDASFFHLSEIRIEYDKTIPGYDPSQTYEFYILANKENEADPATKGTKYAKPDTPNNIKLYILKESDEGSISTYDNFGVDGMLSNLYSNVNISLKKSTTGVIGEFKLNNQIYTIPDIGNSSEITSASRLAVEKVIKHYKDVGKNPTNLSEIGFHFLSKRMGDWLQALSLFDRSRNYSKYEFDESNKLSIVSKGITLEQLTKEGAEIMVVTHDRILLAYSILLGLNVAFSIKVTPEDVGADDEHTSYTYMTYFQLKKNIQKEETEKYQQKKDAIKFKIPEIIEKANIIYNKMSSIFWVDLRKRIFMDIPLGRLFNNNFTIYMLIMRAYFLCAANTSTLKELASIREDVRINIQSVFSSMELCEIIKDDLSRNFWLSIPMLPYRKATERAICDTNLWESSNPATEEGRARIDTLYVIKEQINDFEKRLLFMEKLHVFIKSIQESIPVDDATLKGWKIENTDPILIDLFEKTGDKKYPEFLQIEFVKEGIFNDTRNANERNRNTLRCRSLITPEGLATEKYKQFQSGILTKIQQDVDVFYTKLGRAGHITIDDLRIFLPIDLGNVVVNSIRNDMWRILAGQLESRQVIYEREEKERLEKEEELERSLMASINAERIAEGLPPIDWNNIEKNVEGGMRGGAGWELISSKIYNMLMKNQMKFKALIDIEDGVEITEENRAEQMELCFKNIHYIIPPTVFNSVRDILSDDKIKALVESIFTDLSRHEKLNSQPDISYITLQNVQDILEELDKTIDVRFGIKTADMFVEEQKNKLLEYDVNDNFSLEFRLLPGTLLSNDSGKSYTIIDYYIINDNDSSSLKEILEDIQKTTTPITYDLTAAHVYFFLYRYILYHIDELYNTLQVLEGHDEDEDTQETIKTFWLNDVCIIFKSILDLCEHIHLSSTPPYKFLNYILEKYKNNDIINPITIELIKKELIQAKYRIIYLYYVTMNIFKDSIHYQFVAKDPILFDLHDLENVKTIIQQMNISAKEIEAIDRELNKLIIGNTGGSRKRKTYKSNRFKNKKTRKNRRII